jgi:hypothetical protein
MQYWHNVESYIIMNNANCNVWQFTSYYRTPKDYVLYNLLKF